MTRGKSSRTEHLFTAPRVSLLLECVPSVNWSKSVTRVGGTFVDFLLSEPDFFPLIFEGT